LDTGVNVNHMDFEGRAVTEASFVDNESDTDLGGHGKFYYLFKEKNGKKNLKEIE
jgi:subtilisin family serine protease